MSRRIAFNTLGCRLNQYETDALATRFRDNGFEIVSYEEEADAYVINTCTVTDKSDRKSRNAISRARRQAGNPVVVATGCYTENNKRYLQERLGVTYVVDNRHKNAIFTLLDAHFRGEVGEPDALPGDRFDFNETTGGFHTRRTIKIQDGCDNFCSFCIIPFVRGKAVSRPSGEIVDSINRTVEEGGKEIVLTGVNISRYRHEGTDFIDLVARILRLDGDFRVRISSIEPDLPASGLAELVNHPKFCPHLHLCLQSGSDRILEIMDRQYTLAGFEKLVGEIRKRDADFNFTADIMVGFPGETDADFEDTSRVVRQMQFSHIHTFPYSMRTGTAAAAMSDQLPENIKSERAKLIRMISDKNKKEYRRRFIGKEQIILVEKIRDGMGHGYGEHYVPVQFKIKSAAGFSPAKLVNTLQQVRLVSLGNDKNLVLSGMQL